MVPPWWSHTGGSCFSRATTARLHLLRAGGQRGRDRAPAGGGAASGGRDRALRVVARRGMRKDFDMIVDLMLQAGLLQKPMRFEEYVDTRFAEGASGAASWRFEAGE